LHTWPQFLPDGHHFLYRAYGPNSASTGIYLGSLDSPTLHEQLSTANSNPMYSGGYVLFGREGTLFAQAFDVRRTRLGGDPVPIAEQVLQNPMSGQVSGATSEAGILAYRGLQLQQLVWVDRTGRVLGQVGPAGMYKDPAISPTSDRVAVSRLDPRTGSEDIWLVDAVRGTAARLTFDPARDVAPLFSPDGRHIVFSSNRGPGGPWQLYQRALDDAQVDEPLSTFRVSRPTDWSRDGRLVAFDSDQQPRTNWQVSVLPMTGDRNPVTFTRTPFNENRGRLSPDTRWMAYESDESGTVEVYVRPYPVGGGRWQLSQGGGTEPTWRGDGQELFFVAPDGSLQSVSVRTDSGFAADPARTLFRSAALRGPITGPVGRNRYDVTADGQRFLLVQSVAGHDSSPITVVANWTTMLHP
jgi:dipeptidyl aminopeptidase/acylaminoacyl peptidase